MITWLSHNWGGLVVMFGLVVALIMICSMVYREQREYKNYINKEKDMKDLFKD